MNKTFSPLTASSQLSVTYRPIGELIPDPRNARTHPKRQIEQLKASIKEFGFKIPVLARSDGEVVDGHLRLKAARKLRITDIPVILCDEWTPAQVKAFRLLVNRSVGWAAWDVSDHQKT